MPLRPWQLSALSNWEDAGRRGVVEAATGTGKTMVALASIERLYSLHGPDLRVAVVVPTIPLANQWCEQLTKGLHLPQSAVGELHSASTHRFEIREHVIVVAVLASARDRLGGILQTWASGSRKTLLIVDECHRSGAEASSRIFDTPVDFALGLSATPERDDGQEQVRVYPAIGPPVFRYPLFTALDDDVLAPVISLNLYVDFYRSEAARWLETTARLAEALDAIYQAQPELRDMPSGRLFRTLGALADEEDPGAVPIVSLLAQRRDLLSRARARSECLDAILAWIASSDRKAIIFHESIDLAEETYRKLNRREVAVGLDHSGLAKATRGRELERFRKDRYRAFVAVRALDEGLDVPEADVAVISAGTRSRRQRIQRVGRILRPAEGKLALAISILVRDTPEESIVGGRDTALLGERRVRHHRWPARSIASVLPTPDGHCPPDSYRPVAGAHEEIVSGRIGTIVRDLTLRELGVQLR